MTTATSPAQAHLSAYWAQAKRRGQADATRTRYSVFLEPFVVWVGDRALDEITASQIENEYLALWFEQFQGRNGRLPAPKTYANCLTALKSLFSFCERFDFVTRNPMTRIDGPKLIQRPNDWLSADEDDALLAACQSPQERIIVPFLRFSGLRSGSEFPFVAKRDVDLRAGTITVRHSKTARGLRVIPIMPELVPYITRWLAIQDAIGLGHPEMPFVATRSGTVVAYQQVYDTVKRVAVRGGVRPQAVTDREGVNGSSISPHTLRRTFGSDLLNRGARLEVVSRLLGHGSTRTTERAYASLLDQTIAAEVRAIF